MGEFDRIVCRQADADAEQVAAQIIEVACGEARDWGRADFQREVDKLIAPYVAAYAETWDDPVVLVAYLASHLARMAAEYHVQAQVYHVQAQVLELEQEDAGHPIKRTLRKKPNIVWVYLDALRAFGPDGATAAELATALQMPPRVVFDQLTKIEEERLVAGMDLSPRRYRNRPSSYDYR